MKRQSIWWLNITRLLVALLFIFSSQQSFSQTAFQPIHEVSVRSEFLPLIKGNLYGEVEWRPITPISFSYDWARGRDWNHQPLEPLLLYGFDRLKPHRNSIQMRIHIWEYDYDQWYGMYIGLSDNRTIGVNYSTTWWGAYARKFEMRSLDYGFNLLSTNLDNGMTVNSQIGFQKPLRSRTLDAVWNIPEEWIGVDATGALVNTRSNRQTVNLISRYSATEDIDNRFMTYFEDENGLAGYSPYPYRFANAFFYIKINVGFTVYPKEIIKRQRRVKYLKARYGSAWQNYL